MNSAPPPPRYKIVERGRRLVTIDALTGVELGLSAQLRGRDPVFDAKPVARLEGKSGAHPAAHTPQATPNAPVAASPWGGRPGTSVDLSKLGNGTEVQPAALRWMVLLAAAGLIIFLLIISSLWIVIVAAFVFPLTRGFAVDLTKKLLARAADWARAG